jgi:tetratricopeptide (TPR) repeat protein
LALHSLKVLPSFNGRSELILADIAQARHQFSRAIQIADHVLHDRYAHASPVQAYTLIVTSQLALGEVQAANRSADRLVDMFPNVSTHTLRALVMIAQGRSSEALHDFKRALELETFGDARESAWLRTMMARFYFKQGKLEEASDLLKEALRISPADHLALGLLAEVKLRQDKPNEAITHFEEAFSSSKQIIYLVGQVRAKAQAGDTPGAQELSEQVEKMIRKELANPKGYAHRTELVRLLLDRGGPRDNEEALQLTQAEAGLRRNSETLFYLAKAQSKNGRIVEARETIREVLRTGVQDSEYFDLAANIYDRLKDASEAKYYFEKSAELKS